MSECVYYYIQFNPYPTKSDSNNGLINDSINKSFSIWDFSRDSYLVSGKDYAMIGALSGIRIGKDKSLYCNREIPEKIAMATGNSPDFGNAQGWLYLSEVQKAIDHVGARGRLHPATLRLLSTIELLVRDLGDANVRLIFFVF